MNNIRKENQPASYHSHKGETILTEREKEMLKNVEHFIIPRLSTHQQTE